VIAYCLYIAKALVLLSDAGASAAKARTVHYANDSWVSCSLRGWVEGEDLLSDAGNFGQSESEAHRTVFATTVEHYSSTRVFLKWGRGPMAP